MGTPAPGGCRTGGGPAGPGLQWWHWGRAVAPLCPPALLRATAPVPKCSSSTSPGAAVLDWGGLLVQGCGGECLAQGVLQEGGGRQGQPVQAGRC